MKNCRDSDTRFTFYRGKRVLVTGGTGFVGSHIVETLLRCGAIVRVPVHRRPPFFGGDSVENVPADLSREEDCLRVADGMDFVFHAAGAVGSAGQLSSNAVALGDMATNILLTTRMLQAALEKKIERFLLFSSSTVYPVFDFSVKEEDAEKGPLHSSYFGYGSMRRYLEHLGKWVASRSRLKIALVRPTAVYGCRDNFNLERCQVIPALIRKAVEKMNPYEVWGTGNEMRDFLHASDLARGCLMILEKYPVCDPVNIGYGNSFSISEVVRIILNIAGYEDARLLFDSSKPTTLPVRKVDISKAKDILGFKPEVDLNAGLRDTIRWYVQTKGIREGIH